MSALQREVAKREPHLVGFNVLGLKRWQNVAGEVSAIRTLEIRVFDKRYASVRRSLLGGALDRHWRRRQGWLLAR